MRRRQGGERWGVVAWVVAVVLTVMMGLNYANLPTDKGAPRRLKLTLGGGNLYGRGKTLNVTFSTCESGMEVCDDQRWCYLYKQQCDGLVDCPDASDETVCSCSDYLALTELCDGYADCPDFSDELGCFECKAGEERCVAGGESVCVGEAERCDGVAWCDDGMDEALCSRLTLKQVDTTTRMSFRSKGYLHMKREGEWLPFCGHRNQNLQQEIDSLCDEIVGEGREGKNTYQLVSYGQSVTEEEVRWTHLGHAKAQVYVTSSCSSNLGVYVVCAPPTCASSRFGRQQLKSDQPRIVGGKDSVPNMWTFMVGILRNGVFICGGSIITEEWILTAAHCFVQYQTSIYEVQAGMLRRFSWSPYEQTALVSHVIRHEHYDPVHYHHDIALMKLNTPLQLNRWVRPVCLAVSTPPPAGTFCTVAGWGNLLESGNMSETLQEVDLPVLRTCTAHFTHIYDSQVVCAGFPEGEKDACQGDSGGPFMCDGPDGWKQVGVVSYGRGCARAGYPGVYSRVAHNLPWIQYNMDWLQNPDNLPPGTRTLCDGVSCRLFEGQCLTQSFICDGTAHCYDLEDEKNCKEYYALANSTLLTDSKSSTTPTTTTTTTMTTTRAATTTATTSRPTYVADGTTSSAPGYFSHTTSSSSIDDAPGNTTGLVGSECSIYGVTVTSLKFPIDCSEDDFTCENVKECQPWELVCDGVMDCRDGTDEIGCSCRDRLLGFREDLDCDGYHDCYDLSDEQCRPCGSEFMCRRSRVCVAASSVCDTKEDCEHGEDELNCIGLVTRPGVLQLDRFGQVAGSSEGALVLHVGSEWKTLCIDHLSDEVGLSVCSYLGYSQLRDITYVTAANTLESRPPFHSRIDPKFPARNSTNFMRPEGRHKRSVKNLYMEEQVDWPWVKSSEAPLREDLQFLRDLQALAMGKRRSRRDTCRQAVVRCEREACGKAPLYYFSQETPVWMPGGAPWVASVYVEGFYRCGATLIRSYWLLTSANCMKGVSLETSIVSVVMGSWRKVGYPTRLWGAHEHDCRVNYMKTVKNTDILVIRLAEKMPKTPYINHLCLPSKRVKSLKDDTRCAVAGQTELADRVSFAFDFFLQKDCPDSYVCPMFADDDNICTRSWSGLMACQVTHGANPTWVGVGYWQYQKSDSNCTRVTQHPLFTRDTLHGIRSIIENYTPVKLAKCEGTVCVTGVCVGERDRCDARLSCPDLSDEPLDCPAPLTMCSPNIHTGLCVCPDGGSPCWDGACVPADRICDGVANCPEASDEINCTCCKRMAASASEKLCDGKLDCADQSDEAFCGCHLDTELFRCYNSSKQSCVSRKVVCDGKEDCLEGEDEKHCLALSPAIVVEENVLGIPDRYPQGYLLVRLSGQWYTYLHSMWKTYLSHLVCLQLSYYRANTTQPRTLDLSRIERAARSAKYSSTFDPLMLNPEYLRAETVDKNTVVFIQCLEKDPLATNEKK